MKQSLLFLTAAIIGFLTGCSSTSVNPSKVGSLSIEATTSVFLVTPADGAYGQTQYTGSGAHVADAFERAFDQKNLHVVTGENHDSLDGILAQAEAKGCTYAVIPRIAHWEDRATEWSGKADQMEVAVKVYSIPDHQLISNVGIKGKSSWFSFGGDHPQDLIQEPINDYVDTLVP